MNSEATFNDQMVLPGGVSLAELRSPPLSIEQVQDRFGKAWTIDELTQDFEIIGFVPTILVVRRKSDGVWGSVEGHPLPEIFANFKVGEYDKQLLDEDYSI